MKNILQTDIKNFYDDIIFPGPYSCQSVIDYHHTWNNNFIDFIEPSIDSNTRVLDVGCRHGLITNVLSYHKNCAITAIDWSESVLYGKSIAEQLNNSEISWIQENFSVFGNKSHYDVIICQGVLHHMPDWQVNISKIKKLLKPNGVLFLGVYHPVGKFLQQFVGKFYKNLLLKKDQTENPFELSWTHKQVRKICYPLNFQAKIPKFPTLDYVFNGGLTLYKYTGDAM